MSTRARYWLDDAASDHNILWSAEVQLQAFKEVEVRVREAGRYGDTEFGTNLMRKAFRADGPLADAEAPGAEQQAVSDLFAGAIGCYKNPNSHRNVTIEADEAAEMIVMASHLLGIVDKRSPDEDADE